MPPLPSTHARAGKLPMQAGMAAWVRPRSHCVGLATERLHGQGQRAAAWAPARSHCMRPSRHGHSVKAAANTTPPLPASQPPPPPFLPMASPQAPPPPPARRLRSSLAAARRESRCLLLPACFDGLSAKLVAGCGGFQAAFFSGFGASAARLGEPDAGIITYSEMEEQGRACCSIASALDPGFPIIGDGDTGFGAAQNIRRAVSGYAAAGFAAISIEDQTFPKRCAFSRGMRAVERGEAVKRVRAALDAARYVYETTGREILVVGRTDVRNDDSVADPFAEAMWRCAAFEDLGCEIVYFEGPRSTEEMQTFNGRIKHAYTMLAQVEKPGRKLLTAAQAADLGYDMCLHGLTMLSASVRAMETVLTELQEGRPPASRAEGGALLSDFDHLYSLVGFDGLSELEERYTR